MSNVFYILSTVIFYSLLIVGVDLGIKDFAITSDEETFGNPKHLRKSEKRLIKLQKDLSRKQKGSNNRMKARIKVARLHKKIAGVVATAIAYIPVGFFI
ncbi:MAG: transposase, OrfB family, central region [Caproiciproducens sp.]|jgi:hypothetical protein|nr:transposase, OrfB family, central region [Caproiciproducens sp.]